MTSLSLADGVRLNTVRDTRFKTNRISVNFFTPLKKETVTTNALIAQLLKKGFQGCDSFTAFNRKLENLYGAVIESDIHKKGDYQVLTLAITTIDDRFSLTKESISEQAASILCDMIFHPITENNGFRESDTELEKTVLIDSIEAEMNEKRIYAINSMTRLMCQDEPYGLPRYGFVEDTKKITSQNARAQYNKLLESAQVEIMFVGCGENTAACDIFKKAFLSASRKYEPLNPIQIHPISAAIKEKTEKMEVSQAKLVFGFAGEVTSKNELAPAMRMMVAILGGTPSSKLFVNVREKLSLCYYCAARYDMSKGVLMIDCGVENENIEKAKQAILKQLEQIQKSDFTEEEIQFALLSLKDSYSSVYESDGSIEAFYLGQLVVGISSSPEQEKEHLNNVTREDIVKAAKMAKLDTIYLLTGREDA